MNNISEEEFLTQFSYGETSLFKYLSGFLPDDKDMSWSGIKIGFGDNHFRLSIITRDDGNTMLCALYFCISDDAYAYSSYWGFISELQSHIEKYRNILPKKLNYEWKDFDLVLNVALSDKEYG